MRTAELTGKTRRRRSRRRVGRLRSIDRGRRLPPGGEPPCPERPPLTPTLQRDGRDDAAAAVVAVAALVVVVVVGVRPPAPPLLTAVVGVLVVRGEARRSDHEAQLCIG